MRAVKRSYRAPTRERQAEQTRLRIAEAAVDVFGTAGWAGATVAAIAARAGVTAQTVYLAVGGKPALLIRAVETAVAGSGDDMPLADRPDFATAYAPGLGQRARIRAYVAATAAAYTRSARLFMVLQEAAASDPVVAEQARLGAERRLAGNRHLAALLRPDADDNEVTKLTDAIWVLTGPGTYVDLVHHRGRTSEEYQSLLQRLLEAVVRKP